MENTELKNTALELSEAKSNNEGEAEMAELEQLRADYNILKKKVEEQEIINGKLLRTTMKAKMGKVNSYAKWSTVVGVAAIFIIPPVFHSFSLLLRVITILLVIAEITLMWAWHLKVKNPENASNSLLDFAKNIKELKRRHLNFKKVDYTVTGLWVVWVSVEMIFRMKGDGMTPAFQCAFILCLISGGLIGCLIGERMKKKMLNQCDDIIRQIEE